MKKSISIGAGIIILLIIGLVIYSNYFSGVPTTPTCFQLAEYVSEFENYYENVVINQDSCQPSFSFETPVSYSNFGVHYTVRYGDGIHAGVDSIENFDAKLREKINITEGCPDLEKYVELSGQSTFPINYFLQSYRLDSCRNLSSDLEDMENRNIMRDFLNSQEKFGDYSSCSWEPYTASSSEGLGVLDYVCLGEKCEDIFFYVTCDGVKEDMHLVVENGTVVRAYFQNSMSEAYRQIYPEDIVLRERNPKWE